MIGIDKSSLHFFVFTKSFGMAPESTRVNTRLRLAEKRREPYASVMTYTETKLRLVLLRDNLAAIRAFRGKRNDVQLQDLIDQWFSNGSHLAQ